MKTELKKNVIKLIGVLIAGILAYFFPLATMFIKIDSEKILTGFDIAIFNTIVSIIFSGIQYLWVHLKMHVNLYIKAEEQESSELYLYKKDADNQEQYDVVLNIVVTGKRRQNKKTLRVRCPELYVLQLSKHYSFIKEIKTSEEYEIDLENMLGRSTENNISISREVRFTLVLEEHNKGNTDNLIVEKKYWPGFIDVHSKGLKLIQK